MMFFQKPLSLFYFSAFLKSQMFLLPVLYLFYLSNGLTTADYFLFQGIIVLVNVLLQLPAGFIGDKIPRKRIILISYSLFLGRILCWLFWKGPLIVFIGEILYALSKALFDTVESPYIYDILHAQNKTHKMVKAYSKLNFSLSLGTGIAALCGAWLYEAIGLKVLLGSEFILISTAIFIALKLPNVHSSQRNTQQKMLSTKIIKNSLAILKNSAHGPFILYSGFIVSFSHFFFWSFQPIMKLAAVPVVLFGIVTFTNNVMRSGCSLLTHRLLKFIPLKRLARIIFVVNEIGLLTGFIFQKVLINHWGLCLLFIFYLCICIVLQLMFTIAQISHLQQAAKPEIRTQVSATNMLIARLFTAIILILPKYLTDLFPLMTLYLIFSCLFFVIGLFLLRRLPDIAPSSSL